jgi:UDP-N-acetylglucosamine 1-carboxyvinyltransferase
MVPQTPHFDPAHITTLDPVQHHKPHTAPLLIVEQSPALEGESLLLGAKNATLVIMLSLILTRGKSVLRNVPANDDVLHIIQLLEKVGAVIVFDKETNILEVDTNGLDGYQVELDIMKKTRASVLAMGPLLARFGQADIAFPGGDVIGARPIDYHIKNFEKMGVSITETGERITAHTEHVTSRNLLLEYPSVGATENLMMFATLISGTTRIINAALEPEVFDLIAILKKMGARIDVSVPATITIIGVETLRPVEHTIIFDRLEAGALLVAGAITGGYVHLPQAPAHAMGMFLMKLQEMGHTILIHPSGMGVKIKATKNPRAVNIKTAPYPGFPTDLQAYTMAALTLAQGTSKVHETVYENRLIHARQLVEMGAQIEVTHYDTAIIRGVEELYGTHVIASDIRASCALVLAGLAATGTTTIAGVHHWKRGYQGLEDKLRALGANISLQE